MSILHIGSALLLAAVIVASTFTNSLATSLSGTRNNPPYTPSNPFPVNKSTNVSITSHLNWTGGDPDNDPVTYNVYFGTNQTPPQVATNITTTMYNPGIMNFSTTYYWRIISWDNNSQSTSGPLWKFTTRANHPPKVPNNPNPGNGAINISIQTALSWKGGDLDNDTVFYDLYFGQNTTPSKIVSNLTNTTYTFNGTLLYNTKYYWRIVATDNHSASTNGSLWMFTTEKAPPGNVTVTITKPLSNSLYINDGFSRNLTGRTIVYGAITITADASSGAGIKNVSFYIDGKLVSTTTSPTGPYTYPWNPTIQFNGLSLRHSIKVVAVDNNGKNASAQINVTKWKFHFILALIVGAVVLTTFIPHTTMKGLVFNLRQTGWGYTFFALRMRFHTTGLFQNARGVILLKRCVIRIAIPPTMIVKLGPPRTLAYLSVTFLGSSSHILKNPSRGILQSILPSQRKGNTVHGPFSSLIN